MFIPQTTVVFGKNILGKVVLQEHYFIWRRICKFYFDINILLVSTFWIDFRFIISICAKILKCNKLCYSLKSQDSHF